MSKDQTTPNPEHLEILRKIPAVAVCGYWQHNGLEAALADAQARIARLEGVARAFAEHHDNGQTGQPGYPRTYGELDVWQAEWDRRYDALRAILAETAEAG